MPAPAIAPRSAGLVWDVLRRRASSAWVMDDDTPRARVLGMLKLERGMNAEAIAALCDGGRFAPEPLTDAERAALDRARSKTRRRILPATIRNGWTRISRKCSATTARRRRPRWRAARRSICASIR